MQLKLLDHKYESTMWTIFPRFFNGTWKVFIIRFAPIQLDYGGANLIVVVVLLEDGWTIQCFYNIGTYT